MGENDPFKYGGFGYLPYSSFFNTTALKAGHVILEVGQFADIPTIVKTSVSR